MAPDVRLHWHEFFIGFHRAIFLTKMPYDPDRRRIT